MYNFSHEPTVKDIEKVKAFHSRCVNDYVRVWFFNGKSRIYKNTEPIVYYCDKHNYSTGKRGYWIVDFVSPELNYFGAFKKLNIIRAKRVILDLT